MFKGLFTTISGRLYASIAAVLLAILALEVFSLFNAYNDAVNARQREVQSLCNLR